MKTKLIHPRNLVAGQHSLWLETVPRDVARDGAPRAFPVRKVEKFRSRFTGAICHRVTFEDTTSSLGESTTVFHGKFGSERTGNFPQEKACVLV